MKVSILAAAIVAALSLPIASAQDKSAPAKPAMNMDMGKPAQEPSAPAAPAMKMGTDRNMDSAKTQANMEKMQQQMDKIASTTEPTERQKLMQEHMQTMQENMKPMRGMNSPKMKGKGEHGGMMMDKKKGDM